MSIVCTLTIAYNANGGSNAPASGSYTKTGDSYPISVTATLAAGSPSRSGYNFLGWSTSSVATSASYYAGGSYTYTFEYQWRTAHTTTLYAVWQAKTYTISYRPGSNGTGQYYYATKTHGVDLALRGATYTRSGYNQVGWATSDGGPKAYNLGGAYTANAPTTLYPVWNISASTFTLDKTSVDMDGSDQVTISITRYNNSFTHTVTVSLGSESQSYTNVGTSQVFTIPLSWSAQTPNSANARATVKVDTYDGSALVGSNSATINAHVPDSVVPTVSVSGTNNSTNTAVQSWDVLVQGYSTITLSATVGGVQGSTVTNIIFSGDGVSQSGTGTSVTSDLLTTAGSRTWTVAVTDSRGRTNTATLTRTVYEYFTPSVTEFSAVRSDSTGAADTVGTYVAAKPTFSVASCGGNNSASVSTISYKAQTAQSYTTAQTGAVSGTIYVIGGGNIAITSWYDVKFELTDAIGNTVVYIIQVPTATGVSFGLNGQCARFGGPVLHDDRFECDWLAQFDNDIIIGSTRLTEAQLIALLNMI